MICSIIKGPTFSEAVDQIEYASQYSQMVEFRIDLFTSLDILPALVQKCTIPKVFTLRSRLQGGFYQNDETSRLEAIQQICALSPEFLDIEYHVPGSFVTEIAQAFPDITKIISFHDFEKMPEEFSSIYESMLHQGASFYKIACKACSLKDTLRLLFWAKEQRNCISVAMGPLGKLSRFAGPVIGSPWVYAACEEGQEQPSCKALSEFYKRQNWV